MSASESDSDRGIRDTRLYDVLGLTSDATADDLKRSYRKLALQLHPDKNASIEATKKFQEVSEAYSILSNPEKKALYDKYGMAGLHEADETAYALNLIWADIKVQVATLLIIPFDAVARLQRINPNDSIWQVTRTIYSKEGLFGFWKGGFTSLVANIWYSQIAIRLVPNSSPFFGSLAALLLSYPTEVLLTCMLTRLVPGMRSGVSQISKSGLGAFYYGFLPYLAFTTAHVYFTQWIGTIPLNDKIKNTTQSLIDSGSLFKAAALNLSWAIGRAAFVSLVTTPLRSMTILQQASAVLPVVDNAVSISLWSRVKQLYSGFFIDTLQHFGGLFG